MPLASVEISTSLRAVSTGSTRVPALLIWIDAELRLRTAKVVNTGSCNWLPAPSLSSSTCPEIWVSTGSLTEPHYALIREERELPLTVVGSSESIISAPSVSVLPAPRGLRRLAGLPARTVGL